jgi:hypothetical protein
VIDIQEMPKKYDEFHNKATLSVEHNLVQDLIFSEKKTGKRTDSVLLMKTEFSNYYIFIYAFTANGVLPGDSGITKRQHTNDTHHTK